MRSSVGHIRTARRHAASLRNAHLLGHTAQVDVVRVLVRDGGARLTIWPPVLLA